MYQRIDPREDVKLMFADDFTTPLINTEKEDVIYTFEEFKNIISVTSLLFIFEEDIKSKEHRAALLSFALSNEKNITHDIRKYILKQLNHLDDFQTEVLKELSRKVYKGTEALDDEKINHFCIDAILDPLYLVRTLDFGNFLIWRITKEIFRSISEEKVANFRKLGILPDRITREFITALKNSNEQYHFQYITAAIHVFHRKFNRNYTDSRSFDFAQELLRTPVAYMNIKQDFKTIMNYSMDYLIEQGRNNDLNRGRGWNM